MKRLKGIPVDPERSAASKKVLEEILERTVEWVALLSTGLSREWWHVGITQMQVAVSPKADAKMDGIGNLYIT